MVALVDRRLFTKTFINSLLIFNILALYMSQIRKLQFGKFKCHPQATQPVNGWVPTKSSAMMVNLSKTSAQTATPTHLSYHQLQTPQLILNPELLVYKTKLYINIFCLRRKTNNPSVLGSPQLIQCVRVSRACPFSVQPVFPISGSTPRTWPHLA